MMSPALAAALQVIGISLFFGMPVLLVVYAIAIKRLHRRKAVPPPVLRASRWMLGLWLAAFVGLCASAAAPLPRGYPAGWFSIGLMGTGWLVGMVLLFLRPKPMLLTRLIWPLVIGGSLLTVACVLSLRVAVLAYTEGQYNNTDEPVVRAELTQNPNDAAARSSMAHIDISHSRWPDAAVQLQQWVRLEPDNEEAQFLLAHADVRAGHREEARAVLQQLADRNDDWGLGARRMLAAMDHPSSPFRP